MTAPTTPSGDDNKWTGIGYLASGCCGIIPLALFFLKQDVSPYVKFHWLQAFAISFCLAIIFLALGMFHGVPGLGALLGIVQGLLSIVSLILWLVLVVAGFTGKDIRVPGLADTIQGFIK